MTDIRRILCPVDFSRHSRRALEQAIMMARWYDARVTVVHVAAPSAAAPYPPVPLTLEPIAMADVDRDSLAAAVHEFVEPVGVDGVIVDVVIRQGLPANEILAEAGGQAADLLVLGTHGRTGFERLLLGSVTEKVLHKADCAVLTVPAALDEVPVAPTPLVKHILCAIDFSDCSLRGLEQAVRLAQEADAKLTLLYVVSHEMDNASELSLGVTGPGQMTLQEFRRQRDAELLEKLEAAVPEQAREFCTVQAALGHGRPWREIIRVASEQQADLIVIGVQGRGAADLVMFGSTTHRVVRQADCPVLTIKGPSPDLVLPAAETEDMKARAAS